MHFSRIKLISVAFFFLARNPAHRSRAIGILYSIDYIFIKSLNLVVSPGSITSINLKRVDGDIKSISY